MNRIKEASSLVLLGLALFIAFPADAHAYIDPGSGSMVAQMAAASIMASLFALKVFWRNLRSKLPERFRRGDSSKDVDLDA